MAEESGGGKQANPEEEINRYLDILTRDPKSRAFAPLAEAYRKAGLLDEAIQTSREGLENHPSYFGGRVALGRALFDKNLFSEAKDEFVQVVQAAPDNLMAQKLLGQAHQQLGSSAEAEKAFRMVLLLDPRDEEAQKSLDKLSGTVSPPAATFEAPPAQPSPTEPEAAPEPPAAPEPEVEPETALESPPPPEAESQPPVEEAEDPFFLDAEEQTAVETGEGPAPAPESAPPPPPAREPAPAPEDESTTSTESVFDAADVDAMADVAGDDDEILGEDGGSPFEMFTKEPREEAPPPEAGEESDGRDEVFEQTFDAEGLQEERESVFAAEEESAPESAPPPPAAGEPAPEPEEELSTSTEPVFDVADMEAMADAAVEDEEIHGDESDSPFEMFTKEPEGEVPPPGEREESGKGEEIFEQTFDVEGLREETEEGIPIFDLAEDVEESPPPEAAPPVAPPAAPPVPEPAAPPPPSDEEEMHAELEDEMHVFDLGEDLEVPAQETMAPASPPLAVEPAPVVEEAPPAPAAPEPVEAGFGAEVVMDLEEEVPTFDLAAELEPEVPAAAVPPAAGLEGGTFDTETLANLYVNQGFYDKAAGVYRRMMEDTPDDAGLRLKLEEVLSLQKMESAQPAATKPPPAPEPPEAVPAPPAPAPPVEARMVPESSAAGEENPVIVELQRFLAQLKERRK